MILNIFNGVLLILYYLCNFLVIVSVITLILLCLFGCITLKFDFPSKSTRCGKTGCLGFKNGDRYSWKVQTEKCLKQGGKAVEEVDQLPVKEANEDEVFDLDMECLMSKLKEFAPANGRALCLFTDKCGCLVAKVEAWGIQERYISKEDEVCCICLSKYSNNAELRQLPCSHFFHKNCLDKWMKIKDLCPLCKGKFDKDILKHQIKLSWREPNKPYWR